MVGNALNEYLESKILSADRVELVQILYQAAVESVEEARRHLKQGDIRARVKQINKAVSILGELTATLNHNVGGDFSRTSHALYGYMIRRLTEANSQQSDPPMAEVSKLLATVLEGWMNCRPSTGSAEASPAGPLPAPEPPVDATPAYREYSSYAPSIPAAPDYAPYAPPSLAEPAYARYAPPAPSEPAYAPYAPASPAAPAYAPYALPEPTPSAYAPYASPYTSPAYVSPEYALDGDPASGSEWQPQFVLSY